MGVDLIGQTIREFEILSELGSGDYGAVYRAHDNSVNRDVAIKVILPQYAENPDFKQRFEAEAKLVAQLEHPHIIPLYSYWQDEKGAFLVMRLVRGGSLRELLQIQGACSLTQIERWLKQLCNALSVAHAADVVHRDLKPDNILLDDLGNAYLTDFGIAKQRNKSSDLTGGGIVGTLAYISPEQIQSQPVSAQSDIYSLGFMLYEMFTGECPYPGVAAIKLIMAHLQDPLPSLMDIRPDLPAQLDDFLKVATAKDPTERYQNTAELFKAFESALQNSLDPSSTSRQQAKPVRPKAETVEERNRQTMLDNVRAFWVEGVLEQSLYQAVRLELGMKEHAEAIDNPWQSVLKVPNNPDEMIASGTSISEIFDRMQGKILILGEPGSGKTTTLLTLARDLLNRAEWDLAHPIPVVFNLSSWAENRKVLSDWMVDELNLKYQVPRKVGQGWLDEEQILPLLDGLDEVAIDVRDNCVEAINTYRDEHGFVDVVVCSRIADYEALRNKLRLNGAIVLQALQREQVDSYLAQAGDGLSAVRKVLEDDEKLRRLTTSPLMLNILTLAYRDIEIDEIAVFDSLEGRRKHLFETYVNRMLERRGTEESYSAEKTVHYLTWLGKNMHNNALSVFHIEHLQRDWLNSRIWRGIYTLVGGFPNLIGNILIGIALILIMSVIFSGVGIFYDFVIPDIIMLLGLILLIIAFTSLFFMPIHFIAGAFEFVHRPKRYFKSINKIKPIERVSWSWSKQKMLRRSLLGGALLGGIVLLTTAILFWSGNFTAEFIDLGYLIIFTQLTVFTVLAVLTGAISGAITSLPEMLRTSELSRRTKPNQGIILSARNGILSILIVAFLTILIPNLSSFLNEEIYITIFSIFAFFSFGIILESGSVAVIKHIILRPLLSLSQQAPLNLAQFLDYASERILLRKVGGGYVFLHRMLLDYFANLDEDEGENTDLDGRVLRLSDSDQSQEIGDNIDDMDDMDDMDTELGAQL